MLYLSHVKEQQDILSIFESQKLQTTAATQMVQLMVKWELQHGTKWLVSRLKSMKLTC